MTIRLRLGLAMVVAATLGLGSGLLAAPALVEAQGSFECQEDMHCGSGGNCDDDWETGCYYVHPVPCTPCGD